MSIQPSFEKRRPPPPTNWWQFVLNYIIHNIVLSTFYFNCITMNLQKMLKSFSKVFNSYSIKQKIIHRSCSSSNCSKSNIGCCTAHIICRNLLCWYRLSRHSPPYSSFPFRSLITSSVISSSLFKQGM